MGFSSLLHIKHLFTSDTPLLFNRSKVKILSQVKTTHPQWDPQVPNNFGWEGLYTPKVQKRVESFNRELSIPCNWSNHFILNIILNWMFLGFQREASTISTSQSWNCLEKLGCQRHRSPSCSHISTTNASLELAIANKVGKGTFSNVSPHHL